MSRVQNVEILTLPSLLFHGQRVIVPWRGRKLCESGRDGEVFVDPRRLSAPVRRDSW